jgi:BlaI family transcriptional regulator, penicillinase repressor
MATSELHDLSRRERQIMDLLFQQGQATAADVQRGIPDAPSYSAVRALLRILEDKGFVEHVEEGRTYIYRPTIEQATARESALSHLLNTFFGGSTEHAVAALLDMKRSKLRKPELDRLTKLIEDARREGR